MVYRDEPTTEGPPMMTARDLLAALDVIEPAARAQLAASHDLEKLGEVDFTSDRVHDLEVHARFRLDNWAAVLYAFLDCLAVADAGAEQELGLQRGQLLNAVFAQARAMYENSARSE